MSKARILQEALSVFATKGYAEASLREIATGAGMKAPSLYAHFSNKQALYESVYADVLTAHSAYFDQLLRSNAPLRPIDRIRSMLAGVEAYYRDRPELAEFSLRAAVAERGDSGAGLREIFWSSESVLADIVRRAHADGLAAGDFRPEVDAESLVALVLVVMDGLFLELTHFDADHYHERFELAWRCLESFLVHQGG